MHKIKKSLQKCKLKPRATSAVPRMSAIKDIDNT